MKRMSILLASLALVACQSASRAPNQVPQGADGGVSCAEEVLGKELKDMVFSDVVRGRLNDMADPRRTQIGSGWYHFRADRGGEALDGWVQILREKDGRTLTCSLSRCKGGVLNLREEESQKVLLRRMGREDCPESPDGVEPLLDPTDPTSPITPYNTP